jgi:hypothetical protein
MAWVDATPEGTATASAKAFRVVLVEPATGVPFLWADVNGSGAFESDERFPFAPATRDPSTLQTTIWIGPYSGLFRRYPYLVRYVHGQDTANERALRSSFDTVAEASVNITGRQTLVQIGVRAADGGRIRLDRSPMVFLGIDGNGDGQIDLSARSTEFGWVKPGDDICPCRCGNLRICQVD